MNHSRATIAAAARREIAGGPLRVALNRSNTVVAQFRDGAAVDGLALDLARAVAARLEVAAEFIAYDNAPAIIDDRDRWHCAFIAADRASSDGLVLTAPYLSIDAVLAVPAESPARRVVELDRPETVIASVAGSAFGKRLATFIRHAKIVEFPSPADAWQVLSAGEARAAAGLRPALAWEVDRDPRFRVLEESFATLGQAIAVPARFATLLRVAEDCVTDRRYK